ncbi:M20 aminoacylase family protein [Sphingomonas sp. RIT328]|uniref:M20 aminoacylase family protein n=1 Tax=Sphingomonas sp. RIT328 TaxID=1470591 RepID=UPI0004514AC4|nr:M20 aminoacylase family protein [Sphingomonas sp. RIT328]EZP49981.1 Peptidase M20D, amidohydrolase [Sphingomonas sp. RIT328]
MPSIRALTEAEANGLREHRHWLHAHPEIAFKEHLTAAHVAQELERLGLVPERGLAGTGVVATIEGRPGGRTVGLRADMDGLPIEETGTLPYASRHPGAMHACGHDGHTAMLLGAARLLAEDRSFAGRVHLVFQPAEETEGGGRVMVEDGLFRRYPMDAIFALHNWPGIATGRVAVRAGAMMASFDVFEITLAGKGGHAAMPHRVDDVVVAGCELVAALQTVVSRRLDPSDAAVLSVTGVQSGGTWNVLPDVFVLRGSCRALSHGTRAGLEKSIRTIADGVAAAHGLSAKVEYERRVPATINEPHCARMAAQTAVEIFGSDRVETEFAATMAGEDFAFMLERCPGAYLWIGVGEEHAPLHSQAYDFNDAVLGDGARLLAALAIASLRTTGRTTA